MYLLQVAARGLVRARIALAAGSLVCWLAGSASTPDNTYLKSEALLSGDVRLGAVSLQVLHTLETGDSLRAELTGKLIEIDYTPPENFLIGKDETVRAFSPGLNLQGRHGLTQATSVRLSAGYNEGFSNYRSLWIDRYYRQLYGAFPAYRKSAPYSAYTELVLTHEFLPSTGIIEGGVSFQYEEAPGIWDFTIEDGLVPLDTITRTLAAYGSLEVLLDPKTRVRGQAWMRDQTDRDPRLIFSAGLLRALSDRLSLRAYYGHSREGDAFHANSFQLELERELCAGHSVAISASYYRDNGEIEEASSTVQLIAPAARTREIGLKYFYEPNASLRVLAYGGFFESDYAPSDRYAFTSALYADRDYLSAGFSVTFLY